jgi:hypothetical protein
MAMDFIFLLDFVMWPHWPSIHKEELAKFKKILQSFGYHMEHLSKYGKFSRRTTNFTKIPLYGSHWNSFLGCQVAKIDHKIIIFNL